MSPQSLLASNGEPRSLSGCTPEIVYRFDELKATQACGALLERAGGTSNYTRILKLLYLADRRSMEATGYPITGAWFVNMRNGPVLSEVYACIMGGRNGGPWTRYIAREGRYDIRLLQRTNRDELCDFHMEVLKELADRYDSSDFRKMIDVVHALPEWKIAEAAGSRVIRAADVLRILGFDEEDISAVAQENAHIQAADRFFGLS